MRTSVDIQKEIIHRFGFFPPFFQPAFETPEILENLWQQTLVAYVENPIPDLFKEKLAALLGRYCTVPYCLLCHSSALRPLGMTGSEVLDLLETSPLSYEEMKEKIAGFDSRPILGWPKPGSDLEQGILFCCIAVFLNQDTEKCQQKLRDLLEPKYYNFLVLFLGYNRTALNWAEAHPELAFKEDLRVQTHLNPLVADAPALDSFFQNYRGRVLVQAERQVYWLSQENKRILESERRRIYSYFSQAPIGFAVVKEPEHRFVMANSRYEKLMGAKDLEGRTLREVFAPSDSASLFAEMDQSYTSGKGFVAHERIVHVDLTGAGKKEKIFVNVTVEPYRDENQKVAGLMIVLNEVTELVIARIMVQAREERFRKLADAMPQIVWTARPDGILNYTNQRWTEYSGSDIPEVWHEFVHPVDLQAALPIWMESVRTGVHYETEFRIKRRSDETYRWQLVRAEADFDEHGQVECWYGTCTDIDDQKRMTSELNAARSSAEVANETKSSFLANMSHEIRSPLGAIMGFSDLLKSPDLSKEESANYLSVIDRNSQQLLRIIDDILDLSKVEAGKMLIEQIDFSLPELLADFSALMEFRAKDKGITFDLRVASLLPQTVATDPTRLRQILTNVVGNAIKFTDRGSVTMTVSYSAPRLEFRVSDTGVGMSTEQSEKLFQPFHQGDISTTRKFGGTGLGLVLTRRLSEALGGSFHLESSKPGYGSVFVASVAVQITSGVKMLSSQETGFSPVAGTVAAPSDKKLANMKVLVVEDSPDNQVLFRLMLTKAGASIQMANDGQDGVTMALAGDFDLILMDVQMPRMDGHEATQVLRRKGYSKPIIALTAHAMKEERERAIKSGYTDFLTKPLQRETLIEMLLKYKG